VRLLDQMVILVLVFWESSMLFFVISAWLSSSQQCICFLQILISVTQLVSWTIVILTKASYHAFPRWQVTLRVFLIPVSHLYVIFFLNLFSPITTLRSDDVAFNVLLSCLNPLHILDIHLFSLLEPTKNWKKLLAWCDPIPPPLPFVFLCFGVRSKESPCPF
jgi:hypothetical protein